MGDFWAENIRLASLATERFLCQKRHLGQGLSSLSRVSQKNHKLKIQKVKKLPPRDFKYG